MFVHVYGNYFLRIKPRVHLASSQPTDLLTPVQVVLSCRSASSPVIHLVVISVDGKQDTRPVLSDETMPPVPTVDIGPEWRFEPSFRELSLQAPLSIPMMHCKLLTRVLWRGGEMCGVDVISHYILIVCQISTKFYFRNKCSISIRCS